MNKLKLSRASNRWYFIMIAILLLGFLVLSISTYKIFHIVRRHQRQIRDQNMAFSPVELNTVNVVKCRRSAVTVIYVYGLSMILYRVFSLTWPVSMQIYWNKKRVCIRKEFNSQRIDLGHQHGRRFIVLGHQYGRRDVMWKHSIYLIL